jgi:dienelactone hydrolase
VIRVLLLLAPLACAVGEILAGASQWDPPADIAAWQYAELRAFYEKQHAAVMPGPADRETLRRIIGAVDMFQAPKPQKRVLDTRGDLTLWLVEWPILRLGTLPATAGSSSSLVRVYGLLWEPKAAGYFPAVIAIGDAQPGRRFLTPRPDAVTFAPIFPLRRQFAQPWLANDREWLMRLGYQTGRHVIGSEVLQVLSAVEFLLTLPTVDANRLEVAGAGQGGLTAVLAAALDVRFSVVRSQGWLDDPTPDWDQPEDRILWGFRTAFTREGVLDLIRPRQIEIRPTIVGWEQIDSPLIEQVSLAQFRQWEAFYRNRVTEAGGQRDKLSIEAKRDAYLAAIGRYPEATGPLEPATVRIYDEPRLTGHRLRVRVYEDVHATGILLVPKDLKAGERRPVVFVQHGLGGRPEDAINEEKVYRAFGRRFAEAGYVVFAPMISTQEMVERHRLVRRSHWAGMTPAGMEARKLNRVIDYLETLPFVDSERIAFYGLSYGGFTALWTAPSVPRFQAVITSGHFNHWTAKTTDPTLGTCYMLYPDVLDMYQFGVLNAIDHSDLAALIAPRPFLIEMGDLDGVIVEPRSLVQGEIAQVMDAYARLGAPQSARVASFAGPHRVDGVEAHRFLAEVLQFPPRD